jgi:hypothetical protein
LVHEITQGLNGWEYDWTKEENSGGKYFKVNLDKLIDEVVVGPYCPKWQFDIIKDILDKYGVRKKVKRSRLTILN